MNTYKIIYANGETVTAKANNALEIVKQFDLCSIGNISTKFEQITND